MNSNVITVMGEALDPQRFQAALNRVHAHGTSPVEIANTIRRYNADALDRQIEQIKKGGPNGLPGQPAQPKRFDSILETPKMPRRDAASSPSAGFHLARQLEYVYAETLEEPLPKLSAMELFPVNTEVPAGARTHTVHRVNVHGRARFYRSGQESPRVGVSQVEEQFPVRHGVASYIYDIFEQQSSAYANTQLLARLSKGARDAILRLFNDTWWFGSDEHGLYGVLNYPWLAKLVSGTTFNSATSADDVIAALNRLANFPSQNSKNVFSPNVMAVSTKLWDYIVTKRMGNTAAGTIETVYSYFLRTNPYIERIVHARELDGAGPGGYEGCLCYRDDSYGIELSMVQAPTALPVQLLGFEHTVHHYASMGGVIMRDVGNNILGWFNVPST